MRGETGGKPHQDSTTAVSNLDSLKKQTSFIITIELAPKSILAKSSYSITIELAPKGILAKTSYSIAIELTPNALFNIYIKIMNWGGGGRGGGIFFVD